MKKIALTISLFMIGYLAVAQDFSKFKNFNFDTPESYTAEQDNALSCANYVLDNPANINEGNRRIAVQFVMRWMTGTPTHSFNLDEKVAELYDGNTDILGLYLAASTKVVLENKGDEFSDQQVYDQVVDLLIAYCSDSKNKTKPSKKLKKLSKERG